MKWIKRKHQESVDPLATAKSRKEIIGRLENMGYFVRPKRIRKPKVGDTIKYRDGAGWSVNTHAYCTATVIEWEHPQSQRGQWLKETGHIRARKISKSGSVLIDTMVHPYLIVKVYKGKTKKQNIEG